ncbi:hypothetical protein BDR05DRAFT_955026 [Suillus weaverae]|nr:hypothetical protein BDR05DRAFT_955026 [Suillus weaverae]
MRLPTYRSSHMARYHPYPRVGLSRREILTQITEENDANHNIQHGDTPEPNVPNLPGNEEQEENSLNLPEAVEVPEAGDGLRVRHRKLTTFIIVVLLFLARILAFNAQ